MLHDNLLLLGDENQGMALVPSRMYERFAREVLQAADDAESGQEVSE
ncbi:MAG: hypothetical protein IJ480_07315 [Clostridia bacterium]|nr:hypothetical protein [Clostridia bacterium]